MIDVVEQHIIKEFFRFRNENALLKYWIKSGYDISRCVVCGKPIKNISVQRLLRPYRWDSRECFEYKPRKIVKLEEEYGLDIVDVLKETTRRYGRIKSQCQALNISIPYLYAIIKKYCGDYLNFMAENANGQRKIEYTKKVRERQSSTKLTN